MSGLILIHSDWKFTSNSFGYIQIEVSDWFGLIFKRFSTNKIQNVFRIGSDWSALSRIHISEWFGIFLIGSVWISIQNFRQGSKGLFSQNYSDSIRFNPNESKVNFQSEWIRINPATDWSKTNIQSESIRTLIHSDWKSIGVRIDSDSLGLKIYFKLVQIHADRSLGLIRINFQAFFNKRDSKRFSDCFGLIRIGSNTVIGVILNSSDWLGINSCPKLSPGIKRALFPEFTFHIRILINVRDENNYL